MTKVKVSELGGAALDWAVATCEGYTDLRPNPHAFDHALIMTPPRKEYGPIYLRYLNYSSEWALGGPIIERERITVVCAEGEYNSSKAGTPDCFDTYWVAEIGRLSSGESYGPQGDCWGQGFSIDVDCVTGPTPLIAAMRCFVSSKLGDEAEIPEELLKETK